jgi:hypothetical protein
MDQDQLFPEPPARRSDDFKGLLGRRIYPTEDIAMLERDGHLLVIKSMKDGVHKLTDAQVRMFTRIVRYSNSETSPGNITVVCVWGYGKGTPRPVIVIDHTGKQSPMVLSYTDWQNWIRRWWRDHGVGR